MGEREWQPVLNIGKHGLMLGLDRDGLWVVGRDAASARPMGETLMPLLSVLEQSYPEVDRLSSGHAMAPAPCWDELLHLALTGSGDYWPERALDWLEGGYPINGLLDAVGQLKDAQGLLA
jgi:hypothetical protein